METESSTPAKGRPPLYTPTTLVRLSPNGTYRLQHASDRRRIVDIIVEQGGIMSMSAIDEAMGFNARSRVVSLIHAGWLVVVEDGGAL